MLLWRFYRQVSVLRSTSEGRQSVLGKPHVVMKNSKKKLWARRLDQDSPNVMVAPKIM